MKLRVKLRWLLVGITLLCLGLAWVAHEVQLKNRRLHAIRDIEAAGGNIQWYDDQSDSPAGWSPTVLIRRMLGSERLFHVRAIELDERIARIVHEIRWLATLEATELEVEDEQAPEAPQPARVGDELIRFVVEFPEIESLKLRGGAATDESLAQFKCLRHLKYLDLAGSRISDDGLFHLAHLNQLESLVLSGTAVTSAGLTHLRNLPSLKSLKLGAIRDGISYYEPIDLTDDGLRHLAQFPQLEELCLAGTRVGDEGLRLLADFPRLRTLDLAQTNVTDEGLQHLARMPQLRVLLLLGKFFSSPKNVSDRGVERLRGRNPDLHIFYLGPGIPVPGFPDTGRKTPRLGIAEELEVSVGRNDAALLAALASYRV